MSARVLKSGSQTTVQDLGRVGQARAGLAPGGAMDQRAFLWANRLLGNPPHAPALEVALGGLALIFESAARVAVTGADCPISIDNRTVKGWEALSVHAGQTVRLGFARSGMRGYVSFPGGLDSPRFAGSASTVLREGLDGVLGRSLAEGDRLMWEGETGAAPGTVAIRYRQHPAGDLKLAFIPGYDWTQFSETDRAIFLNSTWRVGPASNRVAVQLEGSGLRSGPRVLDSVPLVDGTVQVLADGTPLVFMRDRPTIGGYAKLGCIEPAQLDLLAQARPGTEVRFHLGDANRARAKASRIREFFGVAGP